MAETAIDNAFETLLLPGPILGGSWQFDRISSWEEVEPRLAAFNVSISPCRDGMKVTAKGRGLVIPWDKVQKISWWESLIFSFSKTFELIQRGYDVDQLSSPPTGNNQ